MYQHAFVVVADDGYFPGLWALLNSIYAYHSQELRVFVAGLSISSTSLENLRQHPLGGALTVIDTRDFAYPPAGAWEAKQCVLSHLCGKVATAFLLDADLILLSRMDDIFAAGDKGNITTSLDGFQPVVSFDDRYLSYGARIVNNEKPYFNSGLLCLNLLKHWELLALWEFTSRFASYSPGGGSPYRFAGHGDQGTLNALASLLDKYANLKVLPSELWCNSAGWSASETVDVVAARELQFEVTHRRLSQPQRLLHSSGPKWWTAAGREHFGMSGDVLKCFDHFSQLFRTSVGTSSTAALENGVDACAVDCTITSSLAASTARSEVQNTLERTTHTSHNSLTVPVHGLQRELVIIVPSRGRPENIAALRESFQNTQAAASLVVAVDDDDPTLAEYLALQLEDLRIGHRSGIGMARPLNEVARQVQNSFKHIGFMGDDHRPRTKHWDRHFVTALDAAAAGVVYGNDLYQGPNLPTAVALTGNIVRALNGMGPQTMVHLFLDNFWKRLGNDLGSLTYFDNVVIEHMHPSAGKAHSDAVYDEVNTSELFHADRIALEAYLASADYVALVGTLKSGTAR